MAWGLAGVWHAFWHSGAIKILFPGLPICSVYLYLQKVYRKFMLSLALYLINTAFTILSFTCTVSQGSYHVHVSQSSYHVHVSQGSYHVHVSQSSYHVHVSHSSYHVHVSHSSYHVHVSQSPYHVHVSQSSYHVHGIQSSMRSDSFVVCQFGI